MTSPFTTPFGCSPLGVTTSKARTGIRLETFKQPNQAAPLHTSALTSVCEPATTHTMAAPSPQQPFGAQASAAVGGPRTTSAPPTQVAGSPVPGMQPGMTVPAPGTPGYGMPFMGTAPYYPAMTPGMMMPGMPRGGAPQFIPAQAVVKPAGGTPQSQRKRRVAAIEDDSGTVLNKSEIEAAAKEAAAKEAAAKEAAAKPPAPIAVAPPRKPGSGAVITDVTPAPTGDAGTPVVAPTPSPVPAGGATPTSPPAATSAPKEVAPASPAPVSTPVPVLSPMESLAAEKASHPVWVPPVSIVYGVGLEVSESKPADLVKYTRDQLKRLAPETGPRQSKAAWYSGLPAFKVLNKPEGNALSSYGGSRRRAGDAGGRRTGGSRRGGAPASAAGAEGKSGKDFAALRDPTVLLHSAGEGSYTRQMSREKSHAEQIKEEVTSILNKLARDTFDKLSGQILALEITTMEELLAVVSVVYDKAVEFQKFQDLFADLCHKLTRSSAVWILTPEGSHTFGVTFKGSDGKYWCNLTGDKSTDAGQVKDGKATRQYVYGPKATEAEASTDMQRQCSFMRILLNRAQQEFSAEVSYADLEEAEAKDKVDEEAHKAAGTLTDKLADAFQGRKEERQLQGIIRKRKVLSNISFIGELYKVNIAKAMIIDYCIMKLLAGGEDLSPQVVDETDALAFCNLMAVVGSKLESEEGDLPADAPPARGRKLRVHQMMDFLQRLYSEKKHGSIVRFRALDVKEAAERGWTFKDGHVAKTTKTMTKEEFYKAEKEKEMAKKVAALKKKQALSRHGGGGGRDYGGRSGRGGRFDANQDVRVASDATGPSRHAGGGGRRRPGGRPGGPKMSMSSRGGAAAAPAAAAGAGSAASANILEGDALDLRVGSLFIDWGSNLRPQDREDATVETLAACPAGKEIVTSLDEIKASPALGSVLISKGVKVLKDAKEDKERSDAALLLSLAWSKGAIKEVDVTKGLAATLGNYKDTKAYDLPKVDVYLGTLLAPLVSAGHLTPAFLVNLFGSGTAFLAGSGLALLAVVLSTAGVVLPADISLLSLCGPSGFDVRGFAKNVAAAQASTALTAHPDMVTVAALLKWRQDTDRKEAADAVAAWDAGLASAPAAAAASALLQIVADAGSMGMGGDGGAADVAELTKFDAALTHIAGAGKAAGAADFVAFLAEGLGRWALVEEMYKADTRGPAAAALLGHFVKLGLVSAPELKTWKSTKAGPLVSASHAVIARFYKALL